MKIAVWKLVPIDPTEQQLAAVRGKQHPNRPDRWDSNNRRIYQAMIAAAPAAVAVLDALREAEAALEVAIARILKTSPGHSISVTSEAKALVAVRAALAATPAAAAEPFMWAIQGPDGLAYFDEACVNSSKEELQAEVNGLNSGLDPDDGRYQIVPLFLEGAAPAAAAPAPQQSYVSISGELKPDVSVYSTQAAAPAGWKLVPIEPTAEMLESAGATDRDGIPATYKTLYMAMVGAALNPPHACDTPRYCNSVQRCTAMDEQRAAAAPVVLPEPGAWSESLAALVAQVDAGSTADYRALQEHRVMRSARALLAQAATTGVAAPASLGPALYSIDADPEGIRARVADAITGALAFGAQNSGKPPAGHWLAPFWTQARFGVIQFNALRDSAYALLNAPAVEQGEVLVTVSGFTGSGKSAIAGEIEILCRALGLQVQWPDGDSEKNMTHADWTAALEQYKPCVRIVEQNIPFASKKGLSK